MLSSCYYYYIHCVNDDRVVAFATLASRHADDAALRLISTKKGKKRYINRDQSIAPSLGSVLSNH